MKAVVITADDFGLSEEVNEAVEKAHRDGVLSAASLMVAGPAAAHAIAIAKRLPTLRVGLHLVLVDGPAVLTRDEIPELLDAQGWLKADMVGSALRHALRPSVRRQFAAEVEAQFAAFDRSGLRLDHVNAHEHFHIHPGIAATVLASGRRHGMRALRVPLEPAEILSKVEQVSSPAWVRVMTPWSALLRRRARALGFLTPDAVFGLRWTGRMTPARLAGLLTHLPPGLTEIYLHPATADIFDGHAAGYGYREELNALLDPAVGALVRGGTFRLGGYADFQA